LRAAGCNVAVNAGAMWGLEIAALPAKAAACAVTAYASYYALSGEPAAD
jgi:hypothetical protein